MSNTKARDLASLLSGSGTGTIAPALVSDQDNTSTGHFDLPSGTTAERPANPETGHIRHNTTIGLAEYYDGTQWKAIDAPPTVVNISPTTAISGNTEITINGSNFSSGATVKFIGSDGTEFNSPTVTVVSSSQLIAETPSTALSVALEPYDIKVINSSGLSGTLDDALDAGSAPAWSTSSGNIGTIIEDRAISSLSVAATDADGQSVSIALASGNSLPSGVIVSSSGVFTGTPNANGTYTPSGVTHTFDLEATDGVNTTTRTFNILRKWADGTSSTTAANSAKAILDFGQNNYTNGTPEKHWIQTPSGPKNVYCKFHGDGWGWILSHTFGGTNNLTTNDDEVLVKAGFWINGNQAYHLPDSYSGLSGTMATTVDTKIRMSNASNNYTYGFNSNNTYDDSFWAMEPEYDSNSGSNAPFMFWWAHSGNIGRMHLYGDLTDVYPSSVTHGLWNIYVDAASTPHSYDFNYAGSTVHTYSSDQNTPSSARFSLGTLSTNGSHGGHSDGNGTTETTYELWVGSN